MPSEVLKFLFDIEAACDCIAQFTAGKTAEEFSRDVMLRSAVERQFITIGEALQQMLRVAPDLSRSISDSRRIINFRNVMVHGYARLVSDTVWGVVEQSMPLLHREVQILIKASASEKPHD